MEKKHFGKADRGRLRERAGAKEAPRGDEDAARAVGFGAARRGFVRNVYLGRKWDAQRHFSVSVV